MFFSGKPNTKGSLFFFWTFDLIIIIIFNNTCMCNTNTSWYTLHSLEIYSHNMYYSHLYIASFQMWTEKKKRRICIWLIYKSLLNFMWVNTFNTSFHLLCPLLLFFFTYFNSQSFWCFVVYFVLSEQVSLNSSHNISV